MSTSSVRKVARAGHDGGVQEESDALVAAVEAALPAWVERGVERVLLAWRGDVPPDVRAAAQRAGEQAATDTASRLRDLLARDVDEQWTNPLGVLRGAVRYPTEVLRAAGVPPLVRDEFDERHFPDDDYGLVPMTFADVDPALHEPGIRWGAAKARAHLARHGGKGDVGAAGVRPDEGGA